MSEKDIQRNESFELCLKNAQAKVTREAMDSADKSRLFMKLIKEQKVNTSKEPVNETDVLKEKK